jgi:WD40 repeat protein
MAGEIETTEGRFFFDLPDAALVPIRIWDLATGRAASPDEAPAGVAAERVVPHDGISCFTYTSSWDGRVHDWREPYPPAWTMPMIYRPLALWRGEVSPDRRFTLTSFREHCTYGVEPEMERAQPGRAGFTTGVVVTCDGRHAVHGRHDGTVQVWDLARQEVVRTLGTHARGVTGLALTADDRTAISVSWDHTLQVREVSTGRLIACVTTPASLTCCAVTSDGATLIAAESTGVLHVFDLRGRGRE